MARRSLSLQVLALACCALCALWADGCSKDPEVAKREFLKSGDDYVAQGKLNEAVIQYRSAVNQDQRFGDARYKLAETLAKLGDARGAY